MSASHKDPKEMQTTVCWLTYELKHWFLLNHVMHSLF